MQKDFPFSFLLLIIIGTQMPARAQQPTPPGNDALIKRHQTIKIKLANAPTIGSVSRTRHAKSSLYKLSTEEACDSTEL